MPVELGRRGLVVQRAMVVSGSQGSPSRTRVFVASTTRSVNSARTRPGPGSARQRCSSARRTGTRLERRIDGKLEVGVVEYHHRAVAAELSSCVLPAARAATLPPVSTEPTNPQATSGCPRQRPLPRAGAADRLNIPLGRLASAGSPPAAHGMPSCSAAAPRRRCCLSRDRGREDLRAHRVRPVPRANNADPAERNPGRENAAVRGRR